MLFDFDYVAGFLFSPDFSRVALIEKQKPNWQKGKLNAIGGKIERDGDEFPQEAMRREFSEETGMTVWEWRRFCVLSGNNSDDTRWRVRFYFATGSVDDVRQTEVEKPIICDSFNLPENVIPNLRWLVPMALNFAKKQENCEQFQVSEIYTY